MDTMEFDESELEEFRVEALELLEEAETSLLDIESGGSFPDQYFAIFRAFHSLKGASAMLGYLELQTHMHVLENRLSEYKDEQSLPGNLISLFLGGIDRARRFLAGEAGAFEAGQSSEAPDLEIVPEQNSAPAPAVSVDGGKGVVYVIDDEEEILETIRFPLAECGFRVETFTLADDFLEVFGERLPDLVICDYSMPGKNGYEIFQEVQKMNSNIPFVFLSAHMTRTLLIDSLKAGVHAAFEKPVEMDEFLIVCQRAVKTCKLSRMVEASMNLLMFQFTDVEACMNQLGKTEAMATMRQGIEDLVRTRREIKALDEGLAD